MFSLSARVNRGLVREVDVASEGVSRQLGVLVNLSSSETELMPHGNLLKCVGDERVDGGQTRFCTVDLAQWIRDSCGLTRGVWEEW